MVKHKKRKTKKSKKYYPLSKCYSGPRSGIYVKYKGRFSRIGHFA